MEYDRALYRVWERVMEDLVTSPSPFVTASHPESSRGSSNESAVHNGSSNSRNTDGSGGIATGNITTTTNNNDNEHPYYHRNVPFFAPIVGLQWQQLINSDDNNAPSALSRVLGSMQNIIGGSNISNIASSSLGESAGGGNAYNSLPNAEQERNQQLQHNSSSISATELPTVRFGRRALASHQNRVRQLLVHGGASNTARVNSEEGEEVNMLELQDIRDSRSRREASRDGSSRSQRRRDHNRENSISNNSNISSSDEIDEEEGRRRQRRTQDGSSRASEERGTLHHSSSEDEEEHNDSEDDGSSVSSHGSSSTTHRTNRSRNNTSNDATSRALDGFQNLGSPCTQKMLYNVMRFAFFFGIFHVFIIINLHSTYVRNTRSLGGDLRDVSLLLPDSIKRRIDYDDGSERDVSNIDVNREEKIRVGRTCIEYALLTRPLRYTLTEIHASSNNNDTSTLANNQTTSSNDITVATNTSSNMELPRLNITLEPLLSKDEILQIKILPLNGKCKGQCSRTHEIIIPSDNSDFSVDKNTIVQKGKKSKLKNDPNLFNTIEYWEEPHYRFATSEALLYLDSKFLLEHNVSIVNVTLTPTCLATGNDGNIRITTKEDFSNHNGGINTQTQSSSSKSKQKKMHIGWWTQTSIWTSHSVYGLDSTIINMLMYGIKTVEGTHADIGYVQNMHTDERWLWRRQLLELYDAWDSPVSSSFLNNENHHAPQALLIIRTLYYILNKISTLIISLLSFFLITSVTALIVRVLTSSGVVLMFPIFACLRNLGLEGADDRILGLSYPWIGRARHAISRSGSFPESHLIYSHMAKIGLYYVMYEACQAAWSVVLYGKSIPEALPIWIYGLAMSWEYFSMVFVRSALSAYFFPRLTLLYFLAFHFYFYSTPYGYFDVALIPLFSFMVHGMLYTVLALEIPAAQRGNVISMECPREVYNRLGWHEWTAGLPPEWTLFLPLNGRNVPLYDRNMEEEDDESTNDGEDDEGENTTNNDVEERENGQQELLTSTQRRHMEERNTSNNAAVSGELHSRRNI